MQILTPEHLFAICVCVIVRKLIQVLSKTLPLKPRNFDGPSGACCCLYACGELETARARGSSIGGSEQDQACGGGSCPVWRKHVQVALATDQNIKKERRNVCLGSIEAHKKWHDSEILSGVNSLTGMFDGWIGR